MKNVHCFFYTIFIIVSLLGTTNAVTAQIFYPETKKMVGQYGIANNFKGGYNSGNVKNGTGKLLLAVEKSRGTDLQRKSSLGFDKFAWIILEIRFYEGEFSDNGSSFSGKGSIVEVLYEKNYNTLLYIPVNPVNFKKGLNATGIYHFEGTAINEWYISRPKYNPINAKSYGTNIFGYDGADYNSSFVDGKPGLTTLTYKTGEIAKQTGLENIYNHQFIYARTDYRNGERYEGFYANGERFGPGTLYDKLGFFPKSGFWDGYNLRFSKNVFFPRDFFENKSFGTDMIPATIPEMFGNKNGYLYQADKTAQFFIAEDRSHYFYGSFKDGKMEGISYQMDFQKKDTVYSVPVGGSPGTEQKITKIIQAISFGNYANNFLNEGAKQSIDYLQGINGGELAFDWRVFKRSGVFGQDGSLSGCAVMQTENHAAGKPTKTKVEGFFEKGLPTGIYKETNEGKDINTVVTHRMSYAMEPDVFYQALLQAKPNKCNAVSQSELDDYVLASKLKADKWNATAAERAATAKRIAIEVAADRAATAKRIAIDVALDSSRKAENKQACDLANSLIGYKAMRNNVPYFITRVHCGFKKLYVLDNTQVPVGTKEYPLLEVLNYTKTNERGTIEICLDCNGFRNVYRQKSVGGFTYKRETVKKWAYNKYVYINTSFNPEFYYEEYCKKCRGEGYLWFPQR